MSRRPNPVKKSRPFASSSLGSMYGLPIDLKPGVTIDGPHKSDQSDQSGAMFTLKLVNVINATDTLTGLTDIYINEAKEGSAALEMVRDNVTVSLKPVRR